MKNPFTVKEWKLSCVLGTLWVIFATIFVIVSLVSSLQEHFYKSGFNTGANNARVQTVAEIMSTSLKTCEKPLVLDYVTPEGKKVEEALVNVKCLQQATEKSEAAQAPKTETAPVEAPVQ